MIENKLVQAKVDYYYTCDGVQNRNTMTIVVGQNPNKVPSEEVVLNYLQRKHANCTIEIISLEWI